MPARMLSSLSFNEPATDVDFPPTGVIIPEAQGGDVEREEDNGLGELLPCAVDDAVTSSRNSRMSILADGDVMCRMTLKQVSMSINFFATRLEMMPFDLHSLAACWRPSQ